MIATTNQDKLREIRALLGPVGPDTVLPAGTLQLLSLHDLPPAPEPEETGSTFEANARLKAEYYAAHATAHEMRDVMTVAEDSGLEVDALGGEPGVRSARFVRPGASYPERFAEIERRLAQHPERPRTARFVCAIAVVSAGRVVFETRGTVEGEIAAPARGSAGFGYDPIFYFPPYGCTLAEVSAAEKLAVAHRGHAFRSLAKWIHGWPR